MVLVCWRILVRGLKDPTAYHPETVPTTAPALCLKGWLWPSLMDSQRIGPSTSSSQYLQVDGSLLRLFQDNRSFPVLPSATSPSPLSLQLYELDWKPSLFKSVEIVRTSLSEFPTTCKFCCMVLEENVSFWGENPLASPDTWNPRNLAHRVLFPEFSGSALYPIGLETHLSPPRLSTGYYEFILFFKRITPEFCQVVWDWWYNSKAFGWLPPWTWPQKQTRIRSQLPHVLSICYYASERNVEMGRSGPKPAGGFNKTVG